VVTAIPLVCLFNRHQIKHQYRVFFLDDLEDEGVPPPDVHPVHPALWKQALNIGYGMRILQSPYTVEYLLPDMSGILFESLDNSSCNLYIQETSRTLAYCRRKKSIIGSFTIL